MTELTPNLTLAEIVNTHPSLARQLEAHDLDYCCGGATTLRDACATNGLDVAAVLDELAGVATHEPADSWSTMGLVELVDHLEATHHAYLLQRVAPPQCTDGQSRQRPRRAAPGTRRHR